MCQSRKILRNRTSCCLRCTRSSLQTGLLKYALIVTGNLDKYAYILVIHLYCTYNSCTQSQLRRFKTKWHQIHKKGCLQLPTIRIPVGRAFGRSIMSVREARKARNQEEKAARDERKDGDAATSTFSLSYYFCCLCLLPKRFRKEKRKAQRKIQNAVPVEAEAQPDQTISKDEKKIAATKIQAVVRGFQGRQAMKEYWSAAIEEESVYWLAIIRARELAWLEKERRIVARKQVRSILVYHLHVIDRITPIPSFILFLCCCSLCCNMLRMSSVHP